MKAPPIPTDFDQVMAAHLSKMQAIEWFDEQEDYDWLLERSRPDDWHQIAHSASHDSVDPEIFQWIASRPDCEAATALVLFWMAQPEHYLKVGRDRDALNESMNPDHVADLLKYFDMIEYIRNRWFATGYTQRNISFNYYRDIWTNEFERIDAEYGELALKYLPLEMRQSIEGRSPPDLSISAAFPENFR